MATETIYIWLIANMLVLFLGAAFIGMSIYIKHVISSLLFWIGGALIAGATISEAIAATIFILKQ